MTLKLVSDNPEPSPSVAAQARAFADDVEAGTYGEVKCVALALEYDGGLMAIGWGVSDDYKMIGMLEAGKLMVFADATDE
jgi:hypothetical protein